MWRKFESWLRRHMWVKFVVGSLPCSERFSPVFPSPFCCRVLFCFFLINNNNQRFRGSSSARWFCVCLTRGRTGIWKCWFLRKGENRSTRRKTSWSKGENQQQQTQHPHGASTPGYEPGSHWWEASALTTKPSLNPPPPPLPPQVELFGFGTTYQNYDLYEWTSC